MKLRDFVKLYGAWSKLIRTEWEALMERLEREGREDERQKILDELDDVRIYGGSVLAKMAEIVVRYRNDRYRQASGGVERKRI
ncbi:MAG: hypothetical protein DRP00_04755 [Candidatus Aenigmatarchaeota archaeon]|nr:MAG: hypothetical protein DRP00_04755 [Candidatus Aenigmarchaeota archaeon]